MRPEVPALCSRHARSRSPVVTYLILAITCVVSYVAWKQPRRLERLILWPPAIEQRREYDRLVTHGFVHADIAHLLFNMITLYFFGSMIEPVYVARIGHAGYLALYLAAIVVAMLPTYLRHRHDRTTAASARRARCRRCCSRSSSSRRGP
jgi:membrane associated rhomboid family serine protease